MNRMIFKKQKCNTLYFPYSHLSRKKNVRPKCSIGRPDFTVIYPCQPKVKHELQCDAAAKSTNTVLNRSCEVIGSILPWLNPFENTEHSSQHYNSKKDSKTHWLNS